MYDLEYLRSEIKEGKATELIMDGCRANEAREPKQLRDGYSISFTKLINGHHEAALRDPEGVVVALAHVDETDC